MSLSESQKQYIHQGLKLNIREDGRTCGDYREYWIQQGNIIQSNGSSKVVFPDSDLQILISIKAQVENCIKNQDKIQNQGIITLKTENLNRNNNKDNIDKYKLYIEEILNDFIIDNLNKEQLIIIENKKCWHLYVDIFLLQEYFNLSVIDGIVIGLKAAFMDLKLPKLQVTHNLITGEDEIDLENENITNYSNFDLKEFPLICTIGEVENQLILDLNQQEYESVDSSYIVCFDEQNNINGIKKNNANQLKIENIHKIIQLAFKFGYNLNQKFNQLNL